MLRFSFEWEITYSDVSMIFLERKNQDISELKLNDEWKVMCFWGSGDNRPRSVEIRRQITSEEMLVSGTLSFGPSGQTESPHEFSKLMKPGSSSTEIYPGNSTFSGFFVRLASNTLNGIVFITYSSDNCTCDVANELCKKCIHPKSLVQLSSDFRRLLDLKTSSYSDVNLKCGDILIPAHKNILSARSPVFAAMFANEMKEKLENQVDITDMDVSVVRAMMVYIYTGKTSSLTVTLASDLLFAADKYQLVDLKRLCYDFLKENVSLQNVLTILVLGDLHAEDLKRFAVDYICENCTDLSVFESMKEWKTLRKEKPDLAMDVLTSLVKARDRN